MDTLERINCGGITFIYEMKNGIACIAEPAFETKMIDTEIKDKVSAELFLKKNKNTIVKNFVKNYVTNNRIPKTLKENSNLIYKVELLKKLKKQMPDFDKKFDEIFSKKFPEFSDVKIKEQKNYYER